MMSGIGPSSTPIPVPTVASVTTKHQPRVVNLTHARAWVVTPVRGSDHDHWAALFRAYTRSHHVQPSPETIEAVWRRLHSRNDVLQGLIVRRTYSGPPVGMAHYRAFPQTFGPKHGCFVDDLFVDPAARGEGAASAMLAHLRRLAAVRGWGAVRWLMAADNGRARTVHDGTAARASWTAKDGWVA